MTDRKPFEDPMKHRMVGGEQDPRALLIEAQMTWATSGLEPWLQKEIEFELQDAYDFHDPDREDLSAIINDVTFAKSPESPTLISVVDREDDAPADAFEFYVERAAMNGTRVGRDLFHTEATITKSPDGSAVLNGRWKSSDKVPVTQELANKIKRMVEITYILRPEDKHAPAEHLAIWENRNKQALAFLSSIE